MASGKPEATLAGKKHPDSFSVFEGPEDGCPGTEGV